MKPSTTPTPVNEPSLSYAWYIVGVLTAIYTFSFVDRQIFSLIVAPLRRDLHISDTQVSLLIGFSFAVFYTFFGILIGRLTDVYSRRAIIGIGLFLWSALTTGCALARSFPEMLALRMGRRRWGSGSFARRLFLDHRLLPARAPGHGYQRVFYGHLCRLGAVLPAGGAGGTLCFDASDVESAFDRCDSPLAAHFSRSWLARHPIGAPAFHRARAGREARESDRSGRANRPCLRLPL